MPGHAAARTIAAGIREQFSTNVWILIRHQYSRNGGIMTLELPITGDFLKTVLRRLHAGYWLPYHTVVT
jgi:hypothetical protein